MSIANAVSENCFALASQLVIECDFVKYTIETSGKHKTGKCAPFAYDINSRAVLASLHTGIDNYFNELQEINFNDLTNILLFFEGIGETHLNSILSTMNIPK